MFFTFHIFLNFSIASFAKFKKNIMHIYPPPKYTLFEIDR